MQLILFEDFLAVEMIYKGNLKKNFYKKLISEEFYISLFLL